MSPFDAIEAQRGRLFLWTPVALAMGIGLYFSLPGEPDLWRFALFAGVGAGALCAARLVPRPAPVLVFLALVCAGVLVAGLRTHMVAAPVLKYRFYGPVEGRIVALDRSLSDVPRLTLDRVWLGGGGGKGGPLAVPARVRVALHGDIDTVLTPGTRVMLSAHLSPPPAPSEPGGFNFQRRAWFDRIGAVGYARSPVLRAPGPPPPPGQLLVARVRTALSGAIQARVSGQAGAFAAAVITGDRGGIDRQTLDALRQSNLAHLLAISGLHMGLFVGFVFGLIRYGLALIPPLALRVNAKKVAAVCALILGAGYLAMSGGTVATRRAYIMVATMLIAVLIDKRAISLRAVALAALVILLLEPESLAEPGFQMSFAATTALVAAFGGLRRRAQRRAALGAGRGAAVPGWARPVLAVVLSSAIAGAATAPVGAAHFNQVAQYGLIANLLSVPLMGILVIPAAVIAGLVAPLGLAQIPLEAMRLAIMWILGVAHWVAGLEGGVRAIAAPPDWVLPLMAFGALLFILWQGRARWAGPVAMAVGLALWAQAERPALLIAESGGLIGHLSAQGRVMSKPSGEGFTARIWLENDGDRVTQRQAFERGGGAAAPFRANVAGVQFTLVNGRGWQEKLVENCTSGVVIVPQIIREAPAGGCLVLDRSRLSRTGSLAVRPGAHGPRFVSAKSVEGDRPWTQGTSAQRAAVGVDEPR